MLDDFSERTGINAEGLCQVLLHNGIRVLPSNKFYPPDFKGEIANFFRISVGSENRVKEGMEKLVEVLEYQSRSKGKSRHRQTT